jgi:hypothetical protein
MLLRTGIHPSMTVPVVVPLDKLDKPLHVIRATFQELDADEACQFLLHGVSVFGATVFAIC